MELDGVSVGSTADEGGGAALSAEPSDASGTSESVGSESSETPEAVEEADPFAHICVKVSPEDEEIARKLNEGEVPEEKAEGEAAPSAPAPIDRLAQMMEVFLHREAERAPASQAALPAQPKPPTPEEYAQMNANLIERLDKDPLGTLDSMITYRAQQLLGQAIGPLYADQYEKREGAAAARLRSNGAPDLDAYLEAMAPIVFAPQFQGWRQNDPDTLLRYAYLEAKMAAVPRTIAKTREAALKEGKKTAVAPHVEAPRRSPARDSGHVSMSAEEVRVARQFGLKPEEYRAQKAAMQRESADGRGMAMGK